METSSRLKVKATAHQSDEEMKDDQAELREKEKLREVKAISKSQVNRRKQSTLVNRSKVPFQTRIVEIVS